jgi:hypothetical protein
MQLFQAVLVEGWRKALRHWGVMLPLYLTGLLLGLVQTWPLLANGNQALYTPFLGELAAGGSDVYISLFLSDPTRAGQILGAWVGIALLFGLLFGLAYNFYSGGAVSVYAGTRPFWSGCRRTFWAFIGLGALLLVLLALAIVVAALFGLALGAGGAVIVALLLIGLINLFGEYARALAAHDRRNPFALLGMAIGFCVRNLGGVLVLALIGLLLHGALALLYGAVARALGGSVLLVIWQQLAVIGWLWIKLLRLAWAVSYVQAAGTAGRAATTEDSPAVLPPTPI